jgi:hypothetical protein
MKDIIFDSIRHEAKEATKNTPAMMFGVDMSSYWHNRAEYFECLQKIIEENRHIGNINMQAKLRGYYTDFERNELDMHTIQRNEHIAKALKHFYSAGEDAYEMCKFMNDMYWQMQYQYAYWMQWRWGIRY